MYIVKFFEPGRTVAVAILLAIIWSLATATGAASGPAIVVFGDSLSAGFSCREDKIPHRNFNGPSTGAVLQQRS